MGLTDRSRLYSIKRRQQRLCNQNRNLHSISGLESASQPALKPASEAAKDSDAPNVATTALMLTAREKAWKKYLYAKAIYDETKAAEHWQYLQKCISDYEKTLSPNSPIEAV